MKMSYTFSIVRYVHEPIAGESLNVGVLLYSPEAAYIDVALEYRYERFSTTFARFDGERYKQVLRYFAAAVAEAQGKISESVLFVRDSVKTLTTAADVARRIWSDPGLSFRFSEPMGGIGEDMPGQLANLFARFVTSQYERPESEHLSDDQVWSIYRPRIPSEVVRNLRPKKFTAPDYSFEFNYAFQNERWHVLQPLSMDYATEARIPEKANRWLGAAINLEESPEAADGRFYFLLRPPELKSYQAAYVRAKNILNKMPLKHEFFEEDDTSRLSEELLSHMRGGR
jgi:hypothetical protein